MWYISAKNFQSIIENTLVPGHIICICDQGKESYLFTWRKLYFVGNPSFWGHCSATGPTVPQAKSLAVLMSLKLNTELQTFDLKESKDSSSKFPSNLHSQEKSSRPKGNQCPIIFHSNLGQKVNDQPGSKEFFKGNKHIQKNLNQREWKLGI